MPMPRSYSTYEAKARFSEILRRVRAGERIRIAYRGEEVAEIRPIEKPAETLAQRLARLEEHGVLAPARRPVGRLRPLARRPGALRRFLESRE
jgi:prevent-host-death family protein